MTYTRTNPSPHYANMVRLCREMQEGGSYSGIGAYKHRATIRALIRETDSKTVLDFGCGRGLQFAAFDSEKFYQKLHIFCESWAEALGVDRVDGYDPACEKYARYPEQKYDVVYCVDCLEHVSEADVPWTIEELFRLTNKALFATVALVPAKKNLPNGENAHITLRPCDWWMEHFDQAAMKYPKVKWQVEFEYGGEK